MQLPSHRAQDAARADEPARQGARPKRFAFAAAAGTLFVLLIGTNIPTPLYAGYEKLFRFSPLVSTLVFAIYALVLIPSLLVFGPASDALGRRRVLAPAVVLATVGCGVLSAATGLGMLFAGRILQGIALGAVQGTATAALVETERRGDQHRAAVVGAAVTAGGAATGPMLAGLLAQYGPAPRVVPYLVEIALLAVALLSLRRLPAGRRSAGRWRPRRPTVPNAIRATFIRAGRSVFLSWAVTGLFLALIPAYVATVLHTPNLAVAGGLVALMLAAMALAQVGVGRVAPGTAQAAGLGLLIGGLAALIGAAHTSSIAVVIAASVLAGLGQGLAFGGGLAELNQVAPKAQRGEVLSAFYVIIYLGTAVPVIGVGIIAIGTGLLTAVQIFSIAAGCACLAQLALLRHHRTRATSTA
jgi:MFS family permease